MFELFDTFVDSLPLGLMFDRFSSSSLTILGFTASSIAVSYEQYAQWKLPLQFPFVVSFKFGWGDVQRNSIGENRCNKNGVLKNQIGINLRNELTKHWKWKEYAVFWWWFKFS